MERKEAIEVIKSNWPDSSFTRLREALETLIPELKDEDERIRKDIADYLKSTLSNKKYGDKVIESWIAWLESQGEQKLINSQFTPEQAGVLDKHIDKFLEQNPWSEEDEKILNYLLWFYDTRFRWNDTCHDDIKFGDIVTFLKSIKDRVQPQQSQWRPSENELEVLRLVAEKDGTCLMGLYKNLKKLMEE